MTYVEMVEDVSRKTGLRKEEVRKVLDSFKTTLCDTVKSGEPLAIPGLGKFSKKLIKPRVVFGKMSKGKTSMKFRPFSAVEGSL